MEKITLYKYKDEKIKISMELYFNENDQLIFDGYDIGEKVKEFWGDSDYEYTYTIELKEVKKLFGILKVNSNDKRALLIEIKNRFDGNDAYSKFGEFMDEHNINYKAFTWT
jgi:hypothetical protein